MYCYFFIYLVRAMPLLAMDPRLDLLPSVLRDYQDPAPDVVGVHGLESWGRVPCGLHDSLAQPVDDLDMVGRAPVLPHFAHETLGVLGVHVAELLDLDQFFWAGHSCHLRTECPPHHGL